MGFFQDLFGGAVKGNRQAQTTLQGAEPPKQFTGYSMPNAQEKYLKPRMQYDIMDFQGMPKTMIPALNAIIQQQANDQNVFSTQADASRGLTRSTSSGPNAIGSAAQARNQSVANQAKNQLFAEMEMKDFANRQAQQEFFQNLGLNFGKAQAEQGQAVANFDLIKRQGLAGLQGKEGALAQGTAGNLLSTGAGMAGTLMGGMGGGGIGDFLNFLRGGESKSSATAGAQYGMVPGFMTGAQGLTGPVASSKDMGVNSIFNLFARK